MKKTFADSIVIKGNDFDIDKTIDNLFKLEENVNTALDKHKKIINDLCYYIRMMHDKNLSHYEEDDLDMLMGKYKKGMYNPYSDTELEVKDIEI